MRLCILIFAIGSVSLGAQTAGQDATPKLQPYQRKALENAFRVPFGSFTTPPAPTAVMPLFPGPSAVVEFQTACAIPLTPAPVDPNVDRGITHKLEAGSSVADRMPAIPGLPVCR